MGVRVRPQVHGFLAVQRRVSEPDVRDGQVGEDCREEGADSYGRVARDCRVYRDQGAEADQ